MVCENNLFIQTSSVEKKDFILNKLNNGIKLFETLIPLYGTKEDCYGTSSDVFIEYIIFDIDIDPCIISMIFYTHDTPCIPFCIKIAGMYNLNLQLVYYNEEINFSGQVSIHLNQTIKDEYHGYHQGMYLYNTDLFWETRHEYCETFLNFENPLLNFIHQTKIFLTEKDFIKLKNKFDEFLLFKQFEKM